MVIALDAQETVNLALFEQARTALRLFTATKEELRWRITHHLKTADKTRKAIEQLLATASLGQHQSRADDCACDYAAARPDDAFPGYESPIDVFYGSSLPCGPMERRLATSLGVDKAASGETAHDPPDTPRQISPS